MCGIRNINTHQALAGGGLLRFPQTEVSLKKIPSNLCLLDIRTPEVSNLSLAFTVALVFSQSRLFLSLNPHQRPSQDCGEAPLSSQPMDL